MSRAMAYKARRGTRMPPSDFKGASDMTQDERWQAQYDLMMAFMKENHRRPSKHRLEEHDMLNWYKHTKKMIARGDYPADRIAKFKILQDIADEYRRLNQYI